jgi:hypothetical protein
MKSTKPTKPKEKEPERKEKELTDEERNKKEAHPDQPSAIMLHDNPLGQDFIPVTVESDTPQLVYSESTGTPKPTGGRPFAENESAENAVNETNLPCEK